MGCSVHVVTLLSQTVAASADQNGTPYRFKFNSDTDAARATMSAVFNLTITGGTSPTLDAYVDGSVDGTNWVTIATMTQLTSGSRNERIALAWCGPWVRARVDAGGTAAPSWTGKVSFSADAPYELSTT